MTAICLLDSSHTLLNRNLYSSQVSLQANLPLPSTMSPHGKSLFKPASPTHIYFVNQHSFDHFCFYRNLATPKKPYPLHTSPLVKTSPPIAWLHSLGQNGLAYSCFPTAVSWSSLYQHSTFTLKEGYLYTTPLPTITAHSLSSNTFSYLVFSPNQFSTLLISNLLHPSPCYYSQGLQFQVDNTLAISSLNFSTSLQLPSLSHLSHKLILKHLSPYQLTELTHLQESEYWNFINWPQPLILLFPY